MWIVTEILNKRKDELEKGKLSVVNAISKTDIPSVLFFLGILLAVGCLQEIHVLQQSAILLNSTFGDLKLVTLQLAYCLPLLIMFLY